jgi:hypothetical protein
MFDSSVNLSIEVHVCHKPLRHRNIYVLEMDSVYSFDNFVEIHLVYV